MAGTVDIPKAIRDWWAVLTTVIVVAGSAYLSIYRIGELEKKVAAVSVDVAAKASSGSVEKLRAEVSKKASSENLKGVQDALGRLQLDVAVICTEVVRRNGGDPLARCNTARGD